MINIIQQIVNIIPITVLVALFLFIAREILDYSKKRKERKNKLKVYKKLICEELIENYEALDSINHVMEKLTKAFNQQIKDLSYSVKTDRYDNEYIKITLGKEAEHGYLGMWLKRFDTRIFDKHIMDIVSLDEKLYTSISEVYKNIKQWEKLRNDIVCFLAGEVQDIRIKFIGQNINDSFECKGKNFKIISDLHIQLSGLTITKFSSKAEAINIKKLKAIQDEDKKFYGQFKPQKD
jgi:hypothetical protein